MNNYVLRYRSPFEDLERGKTRPIQEYAFKAENDEVAQEVAEQRAKDGRAPVELSRVIKKW